MFPVLDEIVKQRIIDEILGTHERPTRPESWLLKPNGHYERLPERESRHAQPAALHGAGARARARAGAATWTRRQAAHHAATAYRATASPRRTKRKKRRRED